MYGKLAIAGAIVVYFQTFVDYGFNYTGVRDIANNQNNHAELSRIFWTITGAKVILALISLIILIPLLFFVPFLNQYFLIILLTFLSVPVQILFPEWFFQGMEKMKYITILNVVAKGIFTLLIFLVIKEREDYIFQPILISGGYFFSGIFSVFLIIRYFRISFYKPSIKEILFAARNSHPIFINLIMPNLYNSFSTLLLGYWWGNTYTGIFDAGKKVINLSDQAFGVLNRTFFPYLANNLNFHSSFWKLSLTAAIGFSIMYLIGADFIVRILFSEDFREARNIILIMSISPVLFALMDVFGTNYLILRHKERVLKNITLYSSLLGFILALTLVYQFKHIGAAITLIFVWALRGGLCYLFAMKDRNNTALK